MAMAFAAPQAIAFGYGRFPMNTLIRTLALLGAAAIVTPAFSSDAAPNPGSLSPYFTPATTGQKKPDQNGFIQRWLLLEPINKPLRTNAGFVDSYVHKELGREYFTGQLTQVPRHGDTVTAENETLAWHALDATGFNVKLFRFASNLNKRVYGAVFCAVTVIDVPQEMRDVRLAVGSNSASKWWVNDEEAVTLTGDRRMVMDDSVSKRLILKKGRNVIRGAVINGPGMSDFCVRLIQEDGSPVTSYTINLDAR